MSEPTPDGLVLNFEFVKSEKVHFRRTAYSEISKIANSNLRLGSLADRSFGANAGWFGKCFHKILDPRIDVILGVGEIVAHVRSFAGRGTLVDRSIFAYLYE